jgi:LPXTG-site transpeptidase (sortase) family protein
MATNMIRGHVYNDVNMNSKRDAGETAISAVTINLRDAAGTVVSTAITDANGAYQFSGLTSGVYTVEEVNPAGYASSTLDHVSVPLTTGSIGQADYGDYLGAASTYDPAITKSGSPATAKIGETVIFTLTVGNNGTADALGVQISDTMPDFLDLVNITINPNPGITPTITGNDFTIDFGTVRPTDVYTVTIVTTVNVRGLPPGGSNGVALSTTSIPDPKSNDSATALVAIYSGSGVDMPDTGFAPDTITRLPAMPDGIYHEYSDLSLEIPSIGINSKIVGLSMADNKWDVSWLNNDLGYLEETAFPSWNGNSVITGHVYKADGTPGPFKKINQLKYGDTINLHIYGLNYVYEVREVLTIPRDDIKSALKHEETPWLTLMTCQGYEETSGKYQSRVLVRAALVKLK